MSVRIKGVVCLLLALVNSSKSVLAKMNQTVDPCDDFYEYACGGWIHNNEIHDNRGTIFSHIERNADHVLKDLLTQQGGPDEKDFMRKAKDLFASCMDLETLNRKGASPMTNEIQSIFRGWPLANATWDESQFDFVDAMTKITAMDVVAFVDVYVHTNYHDTDTRIFYLDVPVFEGVWYKEEGHPIFDDYEDFIVDIAKLMYGDGVTVDREQVREIIAFQLELMQILGARTFNITTLGDMRREYGSIIDWHSFLNNLLAMDGVNDRIGEDEFVLNVAPSYFGQLRNLLSTKSNRVKANYMIWRALFLNLQYLSESVTDRHHAFKMAMGAGPGRGSRLKKCARLVIDNIGFGVGHEFIKDNFKPESKAEMLSMNYQLHAAFHDVIMEAPWMTERTKLWAKEKNNFLNKAIGYPDWVTNASVVSTHYENYTYRPDEFFANMVGIKREDIKKQLRSLRVPVETSAWFIPPVYLNCAYERFKNQITFTAVMLQAPVFSIQYPRSLNYGSIGSFVGTRMSHAFGAHGRFHNKHGEYDPWWDNSTLTNYTNTTQCMENQYGAFFYEEANRTLYGAHQLEENIADNAGLKGSFKAYRRMIYSRGSEEAAVPGLNFTHNQLFFLGFTQLWCATKSSRASAVKELSKKHSPSRFRAMGPLWNSQDFSNTFNCRRGSPMNPINKCSVW